MSPELYEKDFCLWLSETVRLLQESKFSELDLPNLVEELEGLARSDKRALRNNLKVILMHLLKWKYQPEKRSSSWELTLREHRRRVQELLEDSPSLKPYLKSVFGDCYKIAREDAAAETKLPILTFPCESPFAVDEALSLEFLTNN